MTATPSQDPESLQGQRAALLLIDLQVYACAPDGGGFARGTGRFSAAQVAAYFDTVRRRVLPNTARLLAASRTAGREVIYTVVESLTRDGRDRSLDYKRSGIFVPKGSRDAAVMAEVAPQGDEIVLPKTASSVFNATNIDYLLRNLGIVHLAICGVLTEQCVESAVRDAADRGYYVTVIADACATPGDHDRSVEVMAGYARILSTDAAVAELGGPRYARDIGSPVETAHSGGGR